MKTQISINNPFGFSRYGFLWQQLSLLEKGRHLDYGAYNGYVIKQLAITQVIDAGVGIDLNKEVVEENKNNLPQNTILQYIEKHSPLPFADEHFDSISILDVIEHVYNQDGILQELRRVLKTGGILVLTAPRKNLFSFLDLGNLKFRFPKLHKWYYEFKHSADDYQSRYLNNSNGLVGDIEKEKMWHQHFSDSELHALLTKNGFSNIQLDGSCLFQRVFSIISFVLPFSTSFMNKLTRLDAKLFSQSNIFSVSQKL